MLLEFFVPKGSDMTKWINLNNIRIGLFYSLTSAAEASDELLFTRVGASDPNFNLRRDAGFMIRRDGVSDTELKLLMVRPTG